ncbi:hypothetical protein R3P38DRAFT_2814026 [Favolaschia claudopus]|uniref:Uncharacterized protein n=1 Tax=Favolaschia claudopus TaxID=2862362 RepID=A0AAV9Z3V1_9AGAR
MSLKVRDSTFSDVRMRRPNDGGTERLVDRVLQYLKDDEWEGDACLFIAMPVLIASCLMTSRFEDSYLQADETKNRKSQREVALNSEATRRPQIALSSSSRAWSLATFGDHGKGVQFLSDPVLIEDGDALADCLAVYRSAVSKAERRVLQKCGGAETGNCGGGDGEQIENDEERSREDVGGSSEDENKEQSRSRGRRRRRRRKLK